MPTDSIKIHKPPSSAQAEEGGAQLRSADYSKFDMGKVYMFILLAILPVVVVYIILSKSIIKGVTAGSVKG